MLFGVWVAKGIVPFALSQAGWQLFSDRFRLNCSNNLSSGRRIFNHVAANFRGIAAQLLRPLNLQKHILVKLRKTHGIYDP